VRSEVEAHTAPRGAEFGLRASGGLTMLNGGSTMSKLRELITEIQN
jgi:hypothetical protein